jgi:hypothetical protein
MERTFKVLGRPHGYFVRMGQRHITQKGDAELQQGPVAARRLTKANGATSDLAGRKKTDRRANYKTCTLRISRPCIIPRGRFP